MEIENFILKHFHETGVWLPTGQRYDDEKKEPESKGGLAKCATCGATLIAPDDGQPRWCTECSYKDDQKKGTRR